MGRAIGLTLPFLAAIMVATLVLDFEHDDALQTVVTLIVLAWLGYRVFVEDRK